VVHGAVVAASSAWSMARSRGSKQRDAERSVEREEEEVGLASTCNNG
jgi:hypothetical protein